MLRKQKVKTCIKFYLSILLAALAITSVFADDHKEHKANKNLVETAAEAGTFETLLAAAQAAGLATALSDDRPLTVFAPTDDAFGALPAGTIQSLLKPENRETLKRILSFHVVSGRVESQVLADDVSLTTLAGPKIRFTATEQGFSVEGARILSIDIGASNGIVHVIDRVMMPPEKMSRVDAQKMILSSINKGAPMFNHGNPSGTVRVYKNTVETLLSSAELAQLEKEILQNGLNNAQEADSIQQSAWELRYTLDDIMQSLQMPIESLAAN